MIHQSESINELATALAAAHGEMENAPKNAENPHFGKRYADLATVINTCRQPLAKHGLAVAQAIGGTYEQPTLRTTLLHKSGQWIAGEFPLLGDLSRVQVLGSLLTYARRYSLAGMVGIAQEDDDANGASGGPPVASRPVRESNPVTRVIDESRGRQAAPSRQPASHATPDVTRAPTSGKGLFAWASQAGKDTGFDWIGEVNRVGKQAGYPARMVDWDRDQIDVCWKRLLQFLAPTPDGGDADDDIPY